MFFIVKDSKISNSIRIYKHTRTDTEFNTHDMVEYGTTRSGDIKKAVWKPVWIHNHDYIVSNTKPFAEAQHRFRQVTVDYLEDHAVKGDMNELFNDNMTLNVSENSWMKNLEAKPYRNYTATIYRWGEREVKEFFDECKEFGVQFLPLSLASRKAYGNFDKSELYAVMVSMYGEDVDLEKFAKRTAGKMKRLYERGSETMSNLVDTYHRHMVEEHESDTEESDYEDDLKELSMDELEQEMDELEQNLQSRDEDDDSSSDEDDSSSDEDSSSSDDSDDSDSSDDSSSDDEE